jgi:hypothetical protein
MTIQQYLDQIKQRYATGIATYYGFRPDLENLIRSIAPNIFFSNDASHKVWEPNI